MRLCVNIDHIATLREARGGLDPDPVTAAAICELAGAEGIVCHLREDRRHINDRDLRILRETVKTRLDLEMAATEELIGICIDTLPDLATFVPERRQELTTESGLDVARNTAAIAAAVERLHDHDIDVSLFVDPVEEQIRAAANVGADIIEIHTGEFANARSEEEMLEQLERIRAAAQLGRELAMGVNAGHGIGYGNVGVIAAIDAIEEISVGHAIIARAVFTGLERAVRDMRDLMTR
jgi:pyridoxine 5-phosphate synthase